MTDLYIIRGLPGSGKSTLAKKLMFSFEFGYHIEADMFFIKNGIYHYDSKKIGEAHEWCQEGAFKALSFDMTVIVSNTFTRRWEIMPYVNMARQLGKTYQIIKTEGSFKNEHGVPDEVIERMRSRWEDWL